jgi:toxin secretion/phage lysis holin
METKALEIKAAITGFFGVIGLFVGWKGALLLIWVAAMVLDYVTGSMAARLNGEWDSSVARAGLWHKGGMIAAVLVAMLFDACCALVAIHIPVLHMTWPGIVYPVVLVWYIITELGSILENSIKMGGPCPPWLAKGLKVTLDTVNKAGEETVSKLDTEEGGAES